MLSNSEGNTIQELFYEQYLLDTQNFMIKHIIEVLDDLLTFVEEEKNKKENITMFTENYFNEL